MKLHRAFAAWLLGCSAALTVGSPAGATTVPEPGGLLTVAISDQPIYPAQYDGDVRTLPPVYAPARYVLLNDFEEPPDLKPPYTPPAGPAAPTPQLALAAMPAPVTNFAGMSFTQKFGGSQLGGGWPPDTNGDVGVSYYIQSVNDGYAIYDKTTGALVAGFTENQLWSGAGTGTPCDTSGIGDPVVLYDTQADRWVLTHFAFGFDLSGNPVPPFYQCFAVSRSGDPVAGGWYLYAVQMDPGGAGKPPAGTLNDYGKFGIWTDCLYMGANGFAMPAGTYAGAEFAAFDRTTLYSGAALTSTNSSIGFLNSGTPPFTVIPANIIGTSSGSVPPAGTAEYFVSESRTAFAFEVRKFVHGATACGTGSSLSAATNVGQTSYSRSSANYVPQKGTPAPPPLDPLEDRLMQKVQYRRIGSAESLWVVHTTGSSTSPPARPQWAQINVSGGTIVTTAVQQQIYAPDSTLYRWMASLAVDRNGNMALGYSTSSSSTFPGIAYSGRLAGDTLGTLPQTETLLVAGGGSQTNNCGGAPCHRWGDYSSMSIDPDDCTFWFTSEYYDTTTNGSSGNWQTRIGSFAFPDCSPKTAQTISFTSTAPVGAKYLDPTYTVTATATSGLPVALSIDASAATVCTLSGSSSGSQVSYTSAGTCRINAAQLGDGTYVAAPQTQQSFVVGKAAQSISFTSTAPSAATFGDPPYTVTAAATSGLAVSLSIAAASASVCSLSGSSSGSQVSIVGAGTCTINANQAGNANYSVAPQVQQSFVVAKAAQSISFTSTAPAAAKFGDPPYTVTATATSGLAVTLAIDSTSTSVCSLSGSTSGSHVSYSSTGTCKINASQAGNANYDAAGQAQQSFSIAQGTQSVNFTSTAPASAKYGDPPYTVTATATSGLAVTLVIDDSATSVCSLSGSTSGSQVSYIAAGTCTIDANQSGNSNYEAATQAQQSFGVAKGSQTVGFTSTAPSSAQLGDPGYTVTATASSTLAVSLTIDAASVSICSLSGSTSGSQVSFLAAGTCTIDADQPGNSSYNAATQVQQSFTISKRPQTIDFTSTAPASARYGDTAYTVTASATSGLAVTLTIDATSTSVCSLTGSQVTYVGTGTCKIDANQAGNSTWAAAAQAQQSFGVGKGSQSITFTSTAPVGAKYGDTAYTVGASASSGLAVTLMIDAGSASVCSLSGAQVSYIGVGTCTIDANQAGNGNYNAAPQVQQSFAVGKASQSVGFTSTAPAGAKYGDAAYTVTAIATSGLAPTLTVDSGSTSVCSLSGNTSGSQVGYIGAGDCTINANQSGNSSYNAATQVQQSFTVGKASQSVAFTSTAPSDAALGDAAYTVTAAASSGLAPSLSIEPSAASICSLDGNASGAHVSFTAAGTCVIDADQGGSGLYLAATQAQQSFPIGPGTPALVFTPQPLDVVAGDTSAIVVTERNPLGQTVDDNTSTVAFTTTACDGPIDLGSAPMVHGVATLASTLRFYTVTDSLTITASTPLLEATSDSFAVTANPDVLFATGFESCRL